MTWGRMTTRALLVFYACLIVLGVGAVVYFGIQPKPVPIIHFSQFENSTVFTESIFSRLKTQIDMTSFLFWGFDPEDEIQFQNLVNWIEVNQNTDKKFDALVIDEKMYSTFEKSPLLLGRFKNVDHFLLNQEFPRFLSGLEKAKELGLRLLILTSPIEASNHIEKSIVHKLLMEKKEYKTKENLFLSFIFSRFPRNRDQESQMSIPCNTGDQDRTGTASLGCLILQNARGNYRKKMKADTWVGQMDQIGFAEYLILITKEGV